MKKLLCTLLIFSMLMSACLISASAEVIAYNDEDVANTVVTATDDEADEWLFYQRFSEIYAIPQWGTPIMFYEEVYYHLNSDGDVEWALIHGSTPPSPLIAYPYGVFENRLIRKTNGSIGNFYLDYAVYDVNDDSFYDLIKVWENEKYNYEVSEYLNEYDVGELIGDVDGDRVISVKDATYIQKCIAGITSYPDNDIVDGMYVSSTDNEYLAYLSDFNRDGVRNIKDATAIQKHIAGIEP